MIATLDASGSVTPPADALTRYVRTTPTGLSVTGDRTAGRDVYVWCDGSAAAASTNLAELVDFVRSSGTSMKLDDFGVSAMLHNSLVPMPRTLYRDVFLLSMGDTLDLDASGGRVQMRFDFDYPWLEAKSRGDEIPDEGRLLSLLTDATVRQLAEVGDEGVLMLSSGKDSPAIALALAEAGLGHIGCVTYRSGPDDPEPPVAADICRRLGLTHQVVDFPQDRVVVRDLLTRFFERAPLPGVDQSQIPYLAALAGVDGLSGGVLEGGGNDNYMSHPMSAGSRRKQRYRIRARALRHPLARVIPVDSPLNYLTRSRAEANFPGRTPRQRHVDRLYSGSVDMAQWWEELSRETADLNVDDMFDVVLRRQIHAPQILLKHKLAATTHGVEPLLPWCDDEVADYYFHLPAASKFDREGARQKILLRNMLATYLDYDADVVGKHYFIFDGAGFIREHMDFVRSEIEESPLWEPDGKRMVAGWLDALPRRAMLWHAILEIFMISGWSNHYPAAIEAVSAR